MPTGLPILLAMLTSSTPAPFTVELVPPPHLGPVAASVRLLYVATREIPFLTSGFRWDLLGRRLYFEPDRKWVEVALRGEGGVLRADGLEREAGGLSRWTLESFEVKYGPYFFSYQRNRTEVGPGWPPVQESLPRLRVLFGHGTVSLSDGASLLRVIPTGDAPAPGVAGLPVGAGGLAEVALPPGETLQVKLKDAFSGQDSGQAVFADAFRLEAALVEERDLPPADPEQPEATEAGAPAAARRGQVERERWESLRAHAAERPGLSVRWAFEKDEKGDRRTRLALRADGAFEPVVLLVTTFIDAQRAVRPAAIRLVPGKAAPSGAGQKDQGGGMPDPSKQRGWLDYKAAWELAGNATTEAALQELLSRTVPLRSGLRGMIDDSLRHELMVLLQIRAADRRTALTPGRGDRAAIDWADELANSMEHLELGFQVVSKLRALRWQDPWIEAALARDAAFLVQVVSDQAGQVELRQGKATDLVKTARSLVAKVAPSLPDADR